MQPIQENLKTIKYLTQEEVSRLFSKIHDKRDRAMFNVVYKYGLRASEAGLLKIDDVDLEPAPDPCLPVKRRGLRRVRHFLGYSQVA